MKTVLAGVVLLGGLLFLEETPANTRPLANAGADRIVVATDPFGTAVMLYGQASSDPDGQPLTFTWTGPFPEGGGAVTGATPVVTLPLGRSTIRLVVSDGEASSKPDRVKIRVVPAQRRRAYATCDVRITHQNMYTTEDIRSALEPLGIGNRAITIGGRALNTGICFGLPGRRQAECEEICRAPTTPDRCPALAEFLRLDLEEIVRDLETFVDQVPDIRHDTTNQVVVNVERPVNPADFGRYEDPSDPERHHMLQQLQEQIIEAFKRRISAVGAVFPRAPLSMYAIIVPNTTGASGPAFDQRMRGFRRAGELGLYDQLQYLSPHLFQNWGPGDGQYPTLELFTRQGIEETASLTDSRGRRKPLAPFLTYIIRPGSLSHNCDEVAVGDMRRQVSWIQEYRAVDIIAFWSGSPDSASAVCQTRVDIPGYLSAVMPVPMPCLQ